MPVEHVASKKLLNYFKQAQVVAENSHDSETQVGSLLINRKSGAVVASGYNGFVRGAPDDKLPTTKPEKYKVIQHSEFNLIANCARHGISMDDCFVVVTLSPCINCLRQLWQCGISEVYFLKKYKDFDANFNMQDLKIELEDLNNFYKITVSPR